jgi:UDP-glucose 4-epimerase
MRALITGGAGFIGSHLAETLLAEGHHVAVLDDLSTGQLENVDNLRLNPRFDLTIDSVTNEEVVSQLIERADVVFHLAAAVGVRLVVSRPIHTIETNVHGTETVLRHAARRRRLVVVASTSEVYGKSATLPFREDADLVLGPPAKIRWGYAASKLVDEFLALAYWQERQLPVIVVRFFNTVGPRQSSRYGMVIPNFVRQALAGAPLTVHGDGSQTRSFTWVGDVIRALTGLIAEPRALGEVFNVGNPVEVSIRDLAFRIKAMTASRSAVTFVPYHEAFQASFEDMPRRVPDIQKIRATIGFEPQVQLDEILGRVIGYWSAQEQHTKPLARATRRVPQLAPAPAETSVLCA